MFRFGLILTVAVLLVVVSSSICFADGGSANPTPLTKLGSGLINVLTGWTEIPRQIANTYKEKNNGFEALTIGTLKGAAYCFGRTMAGAVDAGFFFIPPYDKPLVEPLYKLGKQ